MPDLSSTDLIQRVRDLLYERPYVWAAGLFEGEGCIVIRTDKRDNWGRKIVALQLKMTDRDVVERFGTVMGVGRVSGPHPNGRLKPQYIWKAAARRDVQSVLNKMLPFLGERRTSKAREAQILFQVQPVSSRSAAQKKAWITRYAKGTVQESMRKAWATRREATHA